MAHPDPEDQKMSELDNQTKLEDLLYDLYVAEAEEEAGIYLLKLYQDNDSEILFFSPEERSEIKKLLGVLINDSERHRQLLEEAIQFLEQNKGKYEF